jgi:hypothetical protein
LSLGLPADLQVYSGIINIVLLFVDGLLFGVAIKKGLMSAVFLVVALVLAAYVGLSIPYLSTSDIVTHLVNIAVSMYNHMGAIFVSFPIFFIIGLAIGIWKG